jgi:hypothetical protein
VIIVPSEGAGYGADVFGKDSEMDPELSRFVLERAPVLIRASGWGTTGSTALGSKLLGLKAPHSKRHVGRLAIFISVGLAGPAGLAERSNKGGEEEKFPGLRSYRAHQRAVRPQRGLISGGSSENKHWPRPPAKAVCMGGCRIRDLSRRQHASAPLGSR